MKPKERVQTTKYVTKTIDSFLERGDYNVALLLASIYAAIRLTTIITERILTDKRKWKETHKKLGRLSLKGLLKKCDELEILTKIDLKKLDKIRIQRNSIAHESKLWRSPKSKDIDDIKKNCEFLKDFFQRTT